MQDSLTTMTADPRAEFSRLLEQHRRIVFKVANSYAWDPHDRADLAQEIAAQLWRAFPAYDGHRPFATWMYRIALNVAISQVRDRRQLDRHTVPLEEQEHELAGPGADPLESDQRIHELHRVMAALDPFNRALLLLYLDGHGNREIGEILGLSETAANMETIMEIDELRQAWQLLDRRLEQHDAMQLQLARDGRLGRLRGHLRPLARGQALQMITGALLMLMAAAFWSGHRQETHLLVAGVILHAYGVAMLLAGSFMHAALGKIDHAAPVLDIQRQLAEVRRLYARSGIWLGLCWWLLWVPATMLLATVLLGVDLYLSAPAWIWSNLAVGLAGLGATLWLYRWSRRRAWPRLAPWMENSLSGASLRKAQAVLDEIGRFERD